MAFRYLSLLWACACLAAGAQAAGPEPTREFAPPYDAPDAPRAVGGLLSHQGSAAEYLEVLRDDFDIAGQRELRFDALPAFELRLATDGRHLVPARRGPRASGHPYWEFMAEPGRIWTTGAGVMRAALPFALKEINQNCVHYGLLRLDIAADSTVTAGRWQVASETCQYLKFNAGGQVRGLRMQPGALPDAAGILTAHRAERARRLPLRPIRSLAEDHPVVSPAPFAPPHPSHTTVYGLVVDGVHYRGGCHTRFGPHPFCDVLALPSYSTAKSLFASLSYTALAVRYPGLDTIPVPELVPECALPDGRWRDVQLRHLVNMSTGNYRSPAYPVDEDAPEMSEWFLATTNADKLAFACGAWPRSSPPGTVPVYHSTDTYLLGVALKRFLERQLGPGHDLHRDFFVPEILAPADPGPLLSHTQRTYDADAQPFTSHGLYYHPDDVARIGRYLANGIEDSQLFPEGSLDGVFFRDRADMLDWKLPHGAGHIDGWWGFDIAPHLGCARASWIPFMAGYGGITWALLPNGMVYYFFSDAGHGSWMDAAIEAHKIRPICD